MQFKLISVSFHRRVFFPAAKARVLFSYAFAVH